jgi:hypothetical protein
VLDVPRFFFHADDGGYLFKDDLGMELRGLAEAKCEAVRYAGKLICDAANQFWDAGDFSLTVTDEKGLVLFTLRLSATEAPAIRTWEPAVDASS